MRILITGATGFIGTQLRRQLIADGHDLICVTRSAPPADPEGCQWLQIDLAAAPGAGPAVTADAVIYLAQSPRYREFPEGAPEMLAVNATGVLALLDWARTAGVRSFVYASSANVYAPSALPITETTPLAPQSFYGSSKQVAELLVQSFAQYFHCTVFRLFTVYGSGQTTMLIPLLIDRVRRGERIDIQGADGLRLSPLFVRDAVRFFRLALDANADAGAEVFNLGGPRALSMREMGTEIGKALGVTPAFRELGGADPDGWIADLTALQRRFGAAPATEFASGIAETVRAR